VREVVGQREVGGEVVGYRCLSRIGGGVQGRVQKINFCETCPGGGAHQFSGGSTKNIGRVPEGEPGSKGRS